MHSQVEQLSPVLVEVKVEVPWQSVHETLETAYRKMQRTAHVRGFRPGKVPRGVVKNLMGKSVEREVVAQLFDKGLTEAVTQHALDPIAVSDIGDPSIQEGQPLSFRIKIEVRPKIEGVDTSELVVERTLQPVTEADIDREIEELRKRNADLVTPEPARPAKHGDVLSLRIDVSVDGKPRADLSSDDTRVTLGEEQLLPEIEAVLPGASVGDSRIATLTFPADYSHEPLRGKNAEFRVQVKELFDKMLPDVDDDFARDLEYESLSAMRTSLQARLEELAQRRSDAQVREQLVEKLIDKNPVAVPPSLVERQLRAMVEELQRLERLLGSGLPWNEQNAVQMQVRAERKVRAGLLLGAIAAQEKLSVTEEDLEARLQRIAEQSGKNIAKVRAEYRDERRDAIRSQILQDKLLDYLQSKASIRDGAPEETKAEAPGEDAEPHTRTAKGKSEKKPAEKPAEKKPAGKQAAKKPAEKKPVAKGAKPKKA